MKIILDYLLKRYYDIAKFREVFMENAIAIRPTKICCRCKIKKQITEFGKHTCTKDGLQHKCRECNNAYNRNWDANNRRFRDTQKNRAVWRLKNPKKFNAQQRINDAKRRNPSRIIILHKCDCESNIRHFHHPDYFKPYEVYDLCPACHAKEHARIRLLAAQADNNISTPKDLDLRFERPADITDIASTC